MDSLRPKFKVFIPEEAGIAAFAGVVGVGIEGHIEAPVHDRQQHIDSEVSQLRQQVVGLKAGERAIQNNSGANSLDVNALRSEVSQRQHKVQILVESKPTYSETKDVAVGFFGGAIAAAGLAVAIRFGLYKRKHPKPRPHQDMPISFLQGLR